MVDYLFGIICIFIVRDVLHLRTWDEKCHLIGAPVTSMGTIVTVHVHSCKIAAQYVIRMLY